MSNNEPVKSRNEPHGITGVKHRIESSSPEEEEEFDRIQARQDAERSHEADARMLDAQLERDIAKFRQDFTLAECDNSEGLKYDSEKPRLDLLINDMPLALEEIAAVLTYGANKYSRKEINYDLGSPREVFGLCHASTVTKATKLELKVQGNASHATSSGGKKKQEYRYVSYATQEGQSKSRGTGSVDLVTTSDLKEKTQITDSGKKTIGANGLLRIPSELLHYEKNEQQTPAVEQEIKLISGPIDCANSTYPKKIMIVCLSLDASCAGAKTERLTSTTAMKQGGFAACFAVGATTDLECWETTYQVLSELSLISNPLKETVIPGDGNWQHVENAEGRYLAAQMRHELSYAKGNERDKETNLHELAHSACCALFRLELALRNR